MPGSFFSIPASCCGENLTSRKTWLPAACGRFTWKKLPGDFRKSPCWARTVDFQRIFWWSNTEWQSPEWKVKPADSDASAFVKIVFGSDTGLGEIESVVKQYHAMFDACAVPEHTRKMIMGGTLAKMLRLPDG